MWSYLPNITDWVRVWERDFEFQLVSWLDYGS